MFQDLPHYMFFIQCALIVDNQYSVYGHSAKSPPPVEFVQLALWTKYRTFIYDYNISSWV